MVRPGDHLAHHAPLDLLRWCVSAATRRKTRRCSRPPFCGALPPPSGQPAARAHLAAGRRRLRTCRTSRPRCSVTCVSRPPSVEQRPSDKPGTRLPSPRPAGLPGRLLRSPPAPAYPHPVFAFIFLWRAPIAPPHKFHPSSFLSVPPPPHQTQHPCSHPPSPPRTRPGASTTPTARSSTRSAATCPSPTPPSSPPPSPSTSSTGPSSAPSSARRAARALLDPSALIPSSAAILCMIVGPSPPQNPLQIPAACAMRPALARGRGRLHPARARPPRILHPPFLI